MYLETGLIILGIAMLLLVLFCIPVLIKLWRITSDLTMTVQSLNERLPAILRNLEDISTNINHSTTMINREVQKYAVTAERFHTVMNQVVNVIEWVSPFALRSHFIRKTTRLIPVVKGVMTFLKVLTGGKRV